MRRSKIAEPSRLSRLEIEDFALIERASLEFAAGFTACSGETGSGKTMLLGALAFVLGERSSPDIVRGGAARARVTLEIDADAELRARLEAEGFEAEAGEAAILWREMLVTGKSTARINGRLATAGQLRAVGELLVEQIGQHEQQRLLSSAYQLDLLDAFSGDAALARRAAVGVEHERARALEDELAAWSTDAGRALAELEFARFAADFRRAQALDAVARLARAQGLRAGEVVKPGAGMGVDIAQRRVLLRQIDEDAREDRVLEDVGEIAGVEAVAVVHRRRAPAGRSA